MGNVNDRYDCVPMRIEPKTDTKTDWARENIGRSDLHSRNKTCLIGLRFGTCVNVAQSDFRESPYDTNFLLDNKFLSTYNPI